MFTSLSTTTCQYRMLCFQVQACDKDENFSSRVTFSTSTVLPRQFFFKSIKSLFLPSALPPVHIIFFKCLSTPSPEIQAAFSLGCCIFLWECSPLCLKCLGFLQGVLLCHKDKSWHHSTVPRWMISWSIPILWNRSLCVASWCLPQNRRHLLGRRCKNCTMNDLFQNVRSPVKVKIIFSYQGNTCNLNSD